MLIHECTASSETTAGKEVLHHLYVEEDNLWTELGVIFEQSNKAISVLLQNRLVKVMASFDKALDQAKEDDIFMLIHWLFSPS